MSLLNQIYSTPSRVKGAVQLLARERGQRLKRTSAEELLSPASLFASDDEEPGRPMVAAVISECVRLGLLRENEDVLELGFDSQDSGRRTKSIGEILPGLVLDRVLDSSDDANQDLAAALAWFLAQDVLAPPATWEEFGEALEKQGMKDVLRFNDNKYQMFGYWARYLGLANILVTPVSSTTSDVRLVPDPTDCIRRILPELRVREGERVPVAQFLERLSARCPLFEGGSIRARMDTRDRQSRHLSSTTSHALLRLEEEGIMHLEMLSDAEAVLLIDGTRSRPVSQIAWTATAAVPA